MKSNGKNNKRLYWVCFPFLLLVLFFPFGDSLAEEGERKFLDENLQMDLADQFFREKDYYRAITEYKRFLFFFPRSNRAEEALLKIVQSYFNGQKWEEAISAADQMLKKFPQSPKAGEVFLIKGLCFIEKKEYIQARYFFQRAKETDPESPVAAEAQWQIARSFLKEEKWKEAANEYRKFDQKSKLYPKGEYFAQGLDRLPEIPQKSPETAGFLAAVLPGSGHLYCERYRDAAIAFLLNGAFIWGMVESFQRQNYVVGGILTFFELGWYSGNIYSAVASAHKYNRKKRQEYMEGLERGAQISLKLTPQGQGPIISLCYAF